MRGRRVLMESFVSHGVRHIFGNPGTTETPLLDACWTIRRLEYIVALHEGVAVGAASYYAQASGRPPSSTCTWRPGSATARHALQRAQGEFARWS